jgi:hypothetical protein
MLCHHQACRSLLLVCFCECPVNAGQAASAGLWFECDALSVQLLSSLGHVPAEAGG